ncbi:hypothetical protein NIES4075_22080 [Tolypothrix sp. NIES-4075]|nr:hypothetical protein NIES4075_22080 [Tolypothrix sp. NIES-4075]
MKTIFVAIMCPARKLQNSLFWEFQLLLIQCILIYVNLPNEQQFVKKNVIQ